MALQRSASSGVRGASKPFHPTLRQTREAEFPGRRRADLRSSTPQSTKSEEAAEIMKGDMSPIALAPRQAPTQAQLNVVFDPASQLAYTDDESADSDSSQCEQMPARQELYRHNSAPAGQTYTPRPIYQPRAVTPDWTEDKEMVSEGYATPSTRSTRSHLSEAYDTPVRSSTVRRQYMAVEAPHSTERQGSSQSPMSPARTINVMTPRRRSHQMLSGNIESPMRTVNTVNRQQQREW